MTTHTTIRRAKTLLFGGALALGVFGLAPQASAAPNDFCHQHGHGAHGCETTFGTIGTCEANVNSPTGYVCKEDPPKEPLDVIGPEGPDEDPYGEEAEHYEEPQPFGF